MRCKALKGFHYHLGEAGKPAVPVKKDEVHEIPDEYVEEHLNPLDPKVEFHPKKHHAHFVQETTEPVTAGKKKAKVAEKKPAAAATKPAAPVTEPPPKSRPAKRRRKLK